MALIATNINQVVEFTLPNDTEPKTVFNLGFLDSGLRAYVMNMAIAQDGANPLLGMREVVRYGLKGFNNLTNNAGDQVQAQFAQHRIAGMGERNGLTDGTLDLIAPWLFILAAEILRVNTIAGESEKN